MKTRFVLVVVLVLAASCRTADPSPQAEGGSSADVGRYAGLGAIQWVQTAAEFDALTMQIWRSATRAMRERHADPASGSAVFEEGGCGQCPAAVIVDVDETVLDNSVADARRILTGEDFNPEVWTAWVNERGARAIPGALEFAKEAERLGVTIFYVTNRTQEEEAGTRDNLAALGFPVARNVDSVLTKGDRSASVSSDKSERRRWVASNYRVLLLAGDDLNDFVPANGSRSARDELVASNSPRWGDSWFMLPNPVYGSWERALMRGLPEGASETERARYRLEQLITD